MARVKPSLVEYSGTVGDKVHYTRFGRTYSRNRPQHFNDCQSESQLRQRALFKAMQHTSALFGSMLQRGLTKYAHSKGHTEANEFARINKGHFVYEDGKVHINYPALQLAVGPLPVVKFTRCHADGLHVEIDFDANLSEEKAVPTMLSISMRLSRRWKSANLWPASVEKTNMLHSTFLTSAMKPTGNIPFTYTPL